jgi:arylsulfatase A-like enzyme
MGRKRCTPEQSTRPRAISGSRWLLASALLAVVLCGACAKQATQARNLILISIDTLVPGRMSLYGGPRRTTPHIDLLASESVRFVNAFSTAPWTMPAHASMLTGLYPSTIYARPGTGWSLQRATALAERFRRAGYRTGAVTGGGFVSARSGAARGFESFEQVPKAGRPARAVNKSIAWLETNHDEPFFYFLHTFIVHAPYLDRRYVEPGQGGRLKDLFKQDAALYSRLQMMCCQDMTVTHEERRYMLALYDGGVAAADEMVGRLLAALERLQLMDDTAIIITSDHGQEFWQHTDRGGHGHSLYDDQLRIPLLWYEPGLRAAGQSVSQHVSLIDIVPTIVERFGLKKDEAFDGVDLSPLLDGREWAVERHLYAEAVHHGPKRLSVRTPEAKLILTPEPGVQLGIGGKHPVSVAAPRELFLSEDRAEARNIAGDPAYAQLFEELGLQLEEDRATALAGDPELSGSLTDAEILHGLRNLRAGTEREAASPDAPHLDEETKRQLRELGYLE